MIEYRFANDLERTAILRVMEPWNMHHVPSEEQDELDLNTFFVATDNGVVIGAAGYRIQGGNYGKTTLLGVLPEYSGEGIGQKLQDARLIAMHSRGVKRVITNADRPKTIAWYKKHYGYVDTGTRVPKLRSFGDDSIDSWTTLEMDLEVWKAKKDNKEFKDSYVKENYPPPLGEYKPLIINACITGMIPTKEMTEKVPIHPEEIIADSIRLYDLGVSIVHLHARDEDGKPTWRGEIYEKIVSGIRAERPDMICCISTSGRDWPEFERRSEALEITGSGKPDMASLTLGSLNFPKAPSINSIDMVTRLASKMKEKNIMPELEAFDPGMINLSKVLESKGIIGGTKYYNLLFGSINSVSADIHGLSYMISQLPPDSVWAAAGIGQFQLPMNFISMIAGGNVRVGLEDNIYYDTNKTLAYNDDLVERIVNEASVISRPIATAKQTRQMLGIL